MKLLEPGRIEGVAGVNLPMLLRALTYRDKDMETLVTVRWPAAVTACSTWRSTDAARRSRNCEQARAACPRLGQADPARRLLSLRGLDGARHRRINAKSIMGVMMLAAGKGSTVIIDTEGERADEALQANARTDRQPFWRRRMTGIGP
jgi:hypothetical protein